MSERAARDQLADVIEDAIDSVHDMDVTHRDYANAAADAVLGMIKPLKWETASLNGYKVGRYASRSPRGGWSHYIKLVDGGWLYNGKTYSSALDGTDVALECAIMEANARHRAHILAALGITIP